jgi:high-affinity Fe2+/Pb2+ permease
VVQIKQQLILLTTHFYSVDPLTGGWLLVGAWLGAALSFMLYWFVYHGVHARLP